MVANGEVDLAVADLTISPTRLSLIDFSIPIATGGLAIYRRKPDSKAGFQLSLNWQALLCSRSEHVRTLFDSTQSQESESEVPLSQLTVVRFKLWSVPQSLSSQELQLVSLFHSLPQDFNLFSFLSPISPKVWISILFALLVGKVGYFRYCKALSQAQSKSCIGVCPHTTSHFIHFSWLFFIYNFYQGIFSDNISGNNNPSQEGGRSRSVNLVMV